MTYLGFGRRQSLRFFFLRPDRGKPLVLSSLEHLLYIPLVILLILVEYATFFACDCVLVAWRLVQQLPFILTRYDVALPLSVENISGLRDRPTPVWSVHFMLNQLVLEQLGLTDLLFLVGFKCTSRLILLTVRKGVHLGSIARGPSCCPAITVLPVGNSCIGIVTVDEAHLGADGTRAFRRRKSVHALSLLRVENSVLEDALLRGPVEVVSGVLVQRISPRNLQLVHIRSGASTDAQITLEVFVF